MVETTTNPLFHFLKENEENQTSEYKEYRRRWNENPKNFIVEEFPIHVDIETQISCNLRCIMCYYNYDPPKYVRMDMSLIKRIIDEGVEKKLCSIKTQVRGDPLTDDRMVEIVRYAKEKGILEVMFNTNAMLLTEEKSRDLIEAGLDKIICSVDGCNKEIYEKIRIGANYDTVIKNIKTLYAIKKKLGLEKPEIRVQMVDTPENHKQITEYMKFWEGIADHIAILELLDLSREEGEDSTPLENFSCSQLWQRLIITAEGDVLPCCGAMMGHVEKSMVVGNIGENTLSSHR